MALEAEIVGRLCIVNVLNRNPSFNRGDGVARGIRKGRNRPRLKFQGRLDRLERLCRVV
jgi:hypothetical protein